MDSLISRKDAIEAVKEILSGNVYWDYVCDALKALSALPSAEAEPTVIRSRTFMPTKDFKEWAKRIKEVNSNAVVIPCDAEVASADAEGSLKAIKRQIDEHWYLDQPSAEAVQGEWKRVETRTYKGECTNCGFRHIFMDGHDSQYRFCPYCGAKMTKGGDSE